MCIRYSVDRSENLLGIEVDGLVTDADLADCVSGVVTDPDVRPGIDVLVNLRGLRESALTSAAIDHARLVLAEFGQLAAENCLAVVEQECRAPRTAAIELLAQRFSTKLQVFTDLVDAKRWLRVCGGAHARIGGSARGGSG